MNIIDYTDRNLIGSSIFFRGTSLVSWGVRLGGFFSLRDGFMKLSQFSHVGTIVLQDNGRLGLLEALQPKVIINDLEERITNCKDKMVLALLTDENRGKILANYEKFKADVDYYLGKDYTTVGALLAGLNILDHSSIRKWYEKKDKTIFCSFVDTRLKQNRKVIPYTIDCTELTPDDDFKLDIYKNIIILK